MACGPSTGPAGYVPHSDPPGVAGAATDGGAATDAARTVNQAAGAMASQPPPPGSLAAKWLVTRVPVAGLAEKCQNPPQLGHVSRNVRHVKRAKNAKAFHDKCEKLHSLR
ncbi:hypothetical protein ABLN67_06545 [Mycobacterium tuberculosis]